MPTDIKKIPKYDIRQLQLRLLDILMVVHQVCQQHNLRYYLVDGSILGAVRHGGFIPWDDDVDLCMPRKDYELLIKNADEWLPKRYEFICFERDPNYPLHFGKIQDSETTLMEKSFRSYIGGIYVDIFPMDGAPSCKLVQRIYHFWYKKLRRLIYFRVRNPYKHGTGPSSWRPLLVQKIFKMETLQRWMKKHMMRYDFETSPIVAVNHNDGLKSMVSRTEVLGDPTPILFEGKEVMGLKDNDAYLKKLFGNYMQLPPEDKRHIHCFHYLDFDHPYREYKKPEIRKELFFVSKESDVKLLDLLMKESMQHGDEVAWFLDKGCNNELLPAEKRLSTIDEIVAWNPTVVIASGETVYPFLPGIKVRVMGEGSRRCNKIPATGWWDIYCVGDEATLSKLKSYEQRRGQFKVYDIRGEGTALDASRLGEAIEDFSSHYQGRMKRKPLYLLRKVALRIRIGYFK